MLLMQNDPQVFNSIRKRALPPLEIIEKSTNFTISCDIMNIILNFTFPLTEISVLLFSFILYRCQEKKALFSLISDIKLPDFMNINTFF